MGRLNNKLGKGNWHIIAPDKLINQEVKTEGDIISVKLTYADGTI